MSFVQSERFRWLLTAAVIAFVALIVLRSTAERPATDAATLLVSPTRTADDSAPESPTPTVAPRIAVDMIGAVVQPGVYYLVQGARVVDAVESAGGLAPDADRERINLAQPVMDGQQIRVPRIGEDAPTHAPAASAESPTSRLIDVNTADAVALETLPGIGPVAAQAIIQHRAGIGRFTQVEELQEVKGIGPSTIERLRPFVTVGP